MGRAWLSDASVRGNNEQLWNCIWQFAKKQHELEIFKHLFWSDYVGKSNLKINKLEQTRKLREKKDTHKLKMQKKGKKETWDGSVPQSISFHAPKAPRIPPESHPTKQLTLHTSLTIMTKIPFTHQTKPTKPTNATIANKTNTTYTKQKQH